MIYRLAGVLLMALAFSALAQAAPAELRVAVYGMILILVILLMPRGIVGLAAGSTAVLGVAFMVGLFGFVLWTLLLSIAMCARGVRMSPGRP